MAEPSTGSASDLTLGRVIGLLLERETIDGADLAAIVGTTGAADHEPAGAPLALTMSRRVPGIPPSTPAILGAIHEAAPDRPQPAARPVDTRRPVGAGPGRE
jgi:hypothetical protein